MCVWGEKGLCVCPFGNQVSVFKATTGCMYVASAYMASVAI